MWIALVKVEFDGIEVIIQYMFNDAFDNIFLFAVIISLFKTTLILSSL